MRILALDLARQLGWAYFSDETRRHTVLSGSVDLAPDNKKLYESYGMRYVRFRRFLKDHGDVDLVAYEAVRRHRRKGQRSDNVLAAHAFGGFRAVLMEWAEKRNTPLCAFEIADLKRRATGKGNCNKDAMIEAANKRFHRRVKDDNEADALWALQLALDEEGIVLKL